MIDELLHFVMYNDTYHDVAEICCSGCWLIIGKIFFLLGHVWEKVCICFIHIWCFAPGFECFAEKYGRTHVVVADVKKLNVIDYFIDFL